MFGQERILIMITGISTHTSRACILQSIIALTFPISLLINGSFLVYKDFILFIYLLSLSITGVFSLFSNLIKLICFPRILIGSLLVSYTFWHVIQDPLSTFKLRFPGRRKELTFIEDLVFYRHCAKTCHINILFFFWSL